jgi:hypothetical protein
MTTQVFSNNFTTIVAKDVKPTDTNIFLAKTGGLPSIPDEGFFMITFKRASDGAVEVCKVLNVNSVNGSIEVERSQENTLALKLKVGDKVSHNLTADTLNEYSKLINDLSDRLDLFGSGSTVIATEDTKGVVEIATQVESDAGTSEEHIVTAFKVKKTLEAQVDYGIVARYHETVYQETILVDGDYTVVRSNGGIQELTFDAAVTSTNVLFDLTSGQSVTVHLISPENVTFDWGTIEWNNGEVPDTSGDIFVEFVNILGVVYGFAGDSFVMPQSGGSWDILTAEYTGNSFYIGTEELAPEGLFFSPDGLSMFVIGSSTDSIYQYTLSSAFDITTVTYTGNSFDVSGQDVIPTDIFFSPDGLNMFVIGLVNDRVYQYTLSSAFDITTASYTGNSLDISTEENESKDVFFSPDGLNMFIVGFTNDRVYQYTLSSAFDITTASYTGNSLDVSDQDGAPQGLFFSSDGLNMSMIGTITDSIYQYTLSSAFDITTVTYTGNSLDVSDQDISPSDIFFSPDGLNMFVIGFNTDSVFQYTLS